MAPRKPKQPQVAHEDVNPNAHILGAGEIVDQPIIDTLEINYMPYAMSVIMSRAIPEIDGFKPSHRKLLYTMYKMGLLTGGRIKSANIVGRTMQLNPHGDSAIYETMVRLSKGNEALLHPYVDSKGNFGKQYSSSMAYAASRYTEAKLDAISAELFRDIEKDTVDMVDNYDATMLEPTLLPVTFPSILINNNKGIAVSMASNICSFNLNEVCEATIELIKDSDYDVLETIIAPDFPGGGQIIYDSAKIRNVLSTGHGSIPVRAKYRYNKPDNCIEVYEIPYETNCDDIIKAIIEKSKEGKIKEVSDVRDETDKNGLKITIDLKRGTDPDLLMKKLYKLTPLSCPFSCNFNVLIGGMPQVLGVKEILTEWIAFRTECVRRRVFFELDKAEKKLHLLQGLEKILLDIDKAIKIVRETEEEVEVVPNLMIGFGIDKIQAEYVAEIKLRHLNREYIMKRLQDVKDLEDAIKDMNDILNSKSRVKKIIIAELKDVMQKYGQPRKSEIIFSNEIEEDEDVVEEVPDYPITIFLSEAGYFKKITPQSLRMSGEQKVKDGDKIIRVEESSNAKELLFFTDMCQVYKSRVSDFEDSKASLLGDYIPSALSFDDGEKLMYMAITDDFKGYMLFFFENGKVAKVDMGAYETKTNRKKLIKAYGNKSPLVAALYIKEDTELVLTSSSGRMLLVNTGSISSKTTKDTQGVAVMTMKKGQRLLSIRPYVEGEFSKPHRFRTKNLPALGSLPLAEDTAGEQLTLG